MDENKSLKDYLILFEDIINNKQELNLTHPLLLILIPYLKKELKINKQTENVLKDIKFPNEFEKVSILYNKDYLLTPIYRLSMDNIKNLDQLSWDFFDEFANKLIGFSKVEINKKISEPYSEVLNNIKDHSCSDKAVMMFKCENNIIDISFYDFGIGFKESLSVIKKYNSEKEALIDGYINHVSSKLEMNRGWGLEHIKNSILVDGELIIISNDCCLYANTNKEIQFRTLNDVNIKGTCVCLRYRF